MNLISKTSIALALGLAAAAAQAVPVPTNLVQNPGFETGSSSTASNWTGNYRSASEKKTGSYSAKLDGKESFETIYQTITGLTSGSTYTLSFWLKWDRKSSGSDNQFKYDFGGFTNQGQESNQSSFDWKQVSKDFTADAASMLLKFYGKVKDEDKGWYLDDVSLTLKSGNVPLPATLPLMGLGLLGLGLARRARRAA